MIDTVIGVVLVVSALYLMLAAFMLNTRNGISALLFQVLPFIIGVANMVIGLRSLGFVVVMG